MTTKIPIGRRTYSFHGGYGAIPDHDVQLAAMAGVTGLHHQEHTMQENRVYKYYPTIVENPKRVRLPSARPQDDAAIFSMSRYMTAKYILISELVRDATQARRLLGATLTPSPSVSPSTPPPISPRATLSAAPPTTPLASSSSTQLPSEHNA
jgi:hypothetical protein